MIRKRMLKTITNMYLNRDINILIVEFKNGKRKEFRVTQELKEHLISLKLW